MATRYCRSRTLRFNGLVIMLATIALPVVMDNQAALKEAVSPLAYLGILIGVGLVNAWLRTQTTTGLKK